MCHTPPASTQPPAGSSPDVDPGALVARVFAQDATSRFTWSETEQPLDRPRPFMYGDRGGLLPGSDWNWAAQFPVVPGGVLTENDFEVVTV